MSLKHELQSVISGNGAVRNGKIIQTITSYLRRKKNTISKLAETKFVKEQETQFLTEFAEFEAFWYKDLDKSKYIGEGAEHSVYEFTDSKFVVKLNDSVYYEFWEDYFNSILIHNYFFPHVAYELLGFYKSEGKLYTAVKQPFVRSTENTNLENVKDFLSANGFINKKNNDYIHPGLGIIVEDLHDENVLTEEGILHFIDTVFFLTPLFFDSE